MAKLTPKQTLFVLAYISSGMNATKAYITAGYSAKNAEVCACQLLRNPKVAAAIAERVGAALAKLDLSVDRVMEYVARLAFFDVANLFEDDGSLKRMKDIDERTRTSIAGLEITEIFDNSQGEQKHALGLLKKVKLSDRRAALDMLMRYHSLYRDKIELTGKLTLAGRIAKARTRIA
jgi:phage terminase small subunit